MGNWKKGLSLIAIAVCGGTISSRAEQAGEGAGNALPETTIAESLPNNGDLFDVRKDLAEEDGITYGITYTGEVLGNPSGGIKQGSAYDGLVRAYVDIDFNKLVGWGGLSSHVSGYQIHSTGHVTSDDIGSLVTASNIEALDGTLLFEAWLEQKLSETLSIRFGQLAADQDFLISDTASLFIANTFGWPVLPSVDLPSGGPIYPLATPGIRVKYEPTQQVDALFAIYNGDPAGPGPGQPQERDPNGVAFRLTDPPLLIGELQWKHDQETDAATLPGAIKVGGWYHFGKFDDLRFGNDGLSLADPASSGQPLMRRGNFAIYGIVDQQLYRLSGQDDKKGISAFARIIGAPSDVNLVDFYADTGLVFSGFVPGRSDDMFGAAIAYSRVSERARNLDRDASAFAGNSLIRNGETAIELNYQAQIASGWTAQPWFQYILNPGGNVANPTDPTGPRAIGDATVVGLRSTVSY